LSDLGYRLPVDYLGKKFVSEFSEKFRVQRERTEHKAYSLYDTFDWRLYHNGLELRQSPGLITLNHHASGKTWLSVETAVDPCCVGDLPVGDLKDQLRNIADMRALINLLYIQKESLTIRILNRNEKTVARLIFEAYKFTDDGDSRLASNYLWIRPVRGYPSYLDKLNEYFLKCGFHTFNYPDLYDELLEIGGHKPGAYSPKLNIPLEKNMRADRAMKEIFIFLLDVMKQNTAGILDDLDTEYLHDYRVAVRRTRAALTQAIDVFPSDTVSRFKNDFAFLGDLTNELRDLDVYLLSEKDFRSKLPEILENEIYPLFDYLYARRKSELEIVKNGLRSESYQTQLKDWETFITAEHDNGKVSVNSSKSIHGLSKVWIYKRYKKINKMGNSILENAEDEKLHRLRIECKKLRYLLEFFTNLYPEAEVKALIKQLKKLQDNLGEFNDLTVQSDYLLSLSDEISPASGKINRTQAAIGALIGTLNRDKQDVKEKFSETFSEFTSPINRSQFRDLFKIGRKAASV